MGVQLRTEEKRILEPLELELPCGYLVSNLHPLEEQSVLETTNSPILNKDVKNFHNGQVHLGNTDDFVQQSTSHFQDLAYKKP